MKDKHKTLIMATVMFNLGFVIWFSFVAVHGCYRSGVQPECR